MKYFTYDYTRKDLQIMKERLEKKREQRRAYYKALKIQRIGGITMLVAAVLLLDGAAGGSLVVGAIGAWMLFGKEVLF